MSAAGLPHTPPPGVTADEWDAAYDAVLRRHPNLPEHALVRKARRVAAIMRHAADGPTWTGPRADRI